MSDALQLLPIYLFMLIPVWIPLAATVFGTLSDLVRAPAKAAAAHREAAPARRSTVRATATPATATN